MAIHICTQIELWVVMFGHDAAHLSRVQERQLSNLLLLVSSCMAILGRTLWGCLLDVDIRADDGGILAVTARASHQFDGSKILESRCTHSSNVTRFNVSAQLRITSLPVAVERVKLTLSMPGCADNQGPRLSSPLRAWKTPGGKDCCANSASLRPQ